MSERKLNPKLEAIKTKYKNGIPQDWRFCIRENKKMDRKDLDRISAYLDAIRALCKGGDEKCFPIDILARDLDNYIWAKFGKDDDEVS